MSRCCYLWWALLHRLRPHRKDSPIIILRLRRLVLGLTFLFDRLLCPFGTALIFTRLADAAAAAVATDEVDQYDADYRRQDLELLCWLLTALVLRFALAQEALILKLLAIVVIAAPQVCDTVGFRILCVSNSGWSSIRWGLLGSFTVGLVRFGTSTSTPFGFQGSPSWLQARYRDRLVDALSPVMMCGLIAVAILGFDVVLDVIF